MSEKRRSSKWVHFCRRIAILTWGSLKLPGGFSIPEGCLRAGQACPPIEERAIMNRGRGQGPRHPPPPKSGTTDHAPRPQSPTKADAGLACTDQPQLAPAIGTPRQQQGPGGLRSWGSLWGFCRPDGCLSTWAGRGSEAKAAGETVKPTPSFIRMSALRACDY